MLPVSFFAFQSPSQYPLFYFPRHREFAATASFTTLTSPRSCILLPLLCAASARELRCPTRHPPPPLFHQPTCLAAEKPPPPGIPLLPCTGTFFLFQPRLPAKKIILEKLLCIRTTHFHELLLLFAQQQQVAPRRSKLLLSRHIPSRADEVAALPRLMRKLASCFQTEPT